MLNFLQFEKLVGVRKLSDFLKPKILKQEEFILPKLSSMLFYGDINKVLTPNDDNLLFKNSIATRPRVYSFDNYSKKGTVGKFKRTSTKVTKYISDSRKENDDFEYVIKRIKLGLTPANRLIIFNFAMLNSLYRYSNYATVDYDRYYNVVKTVVDASHGLEKVSERTRYLIIELPNTLEKVSEYKKLVGMTARKITTIFKDYRALNIFELYRLLQTDHRSKSPFSGLLNNEADDIVLVFTHTNKVTVCKLNNLLALNKEYDIESPINGQSPIKAGSILLYYISQILSSSAATSSELNSNSLTDVSNKAMKMANDGNSDLKDLEGEINSFVEENFINAEEVEPEERKTVSKIKHLEKDDVKSIIDYKPKDKDLYNDVIDDKVEQGLIQPNTAKKQKEILTKQDKILKSLEVDIKDFDVDEKDAGIEDTLGVLDKSYLTDPLKAIERKYIKDFKKKDDKRMIYAMQQNGVVVEDHHIEVEESILGRIDIHKIKVVPPGGRSITLTVRLPHVDEDGRFKMNNNTYVMRKQKSDAPIRKINATQVNLSSYFGKLMIKKASYKKDDMGIALMTGLQNLNNDETSPISLVVPGNIIITDVHLPKMYTATARYVRSFKNGKDFLLFDYIFRHTLLDKEDKLTDMEKGSLILVGKSSGKNNYILIDKDNNLHSYKKGKVEPLSSYLEYINISIDTLPVEYSMVKILGQNIPVVLLTIYYLGFDQLLKTLNVKYKTFESKRKTEVESGDYSIVFKDKVFVFNRKDELAAMLLSGFNFVSKHIKHIEADDLNTTSGVMDILVAMGLNRKHETEIKILKTMFIDPITKDVLEIMKEPITFIGLLFRSNELLLTDYTKPTNDISEILFKGYERMSGMLYHTLSRSLRDYENKFGTIKTKLTVNPYATWAMISEDSTVMLEDDLNPIANLKQKEDVTFTGFQGRSSETLNQAAREYHKSEVGILSEATKDSAEVGITVYTAAAPKLNNVRGVVDNSKKDIKDLGFHNIFSTSTMLAPFGLQDDGKRILFNSIQNGHVIPLTNQMPLPIRTGYETILASRTSDKFVVSAEEPGKVLSVSKTKITVEYKTLGKKSFTLKEWSTKEEAGKAYLHKMVTNMKKGQTFKKDDALSYDELFFGPDMFDRNRVVYKTGVLLTTTLTETQETYEDSSAISERANQFLSTKILKISSIVVDAKSDILNILAIGDKVDYNDKLFTIVDTAEDSELNKNLDLSDNTVAILEELKNSSPKAKINGVIKNITIYYNSEIEDMSPSIKELVKDSDARLKESGEKFTGRVDSTYAIKAVPLISGEVEIKVAIETDTTMGYGDKLIAGLQLKATVGDIFSNQVETEDGVPIDMKFSSKSIDARIVNSANTMGTTNAILVELTRQVNEM